MEHDQPKKDRVRLTKNGKLVWSVGKVIKQPSGREYVVLKSGQWVRIDDK